MANSMQLQSYFFLSLPDCPAGVRVCDMYACVYVLVLFFSSLFGYILITHLALLLDAAAGVHSSAGRVHGGRRSEREEGGGQSGRRGRAGQRVELREDDARARAAATHSHPHVQRL